MLRLDLLLPTTTTNVNFDSPALDEALEAQTKPEAFAYVIPPRSPATMPDGARRPRPPPRAPTPPTVDPPSPSWTAAWGNLFDNLQQDLQREKAELLERGDVSMDSGNVDGLEDGPVDPHIWIEGSEEQLAVHDNFEALLQEPLRTEEEYQANWDLAPWATNVDLVKRKAMIDARIRKMNGVCDED
ncbi:hypothetical protein B0H16DRAFT_1715933 [Mycena metata]|uniref:Uncharacterized protein n=1 Tax=Mycena metata TaxID=1033252 RepID=A0AAD7NP03_9AGAR|nr:hypothetical protein B0H16DRAFT_1715933 [Mycena metata]